MSDILSVRSVTKHFRQGNFLSLKPERTIRAVDAVSLDVGEGEALGIVGESGCGKSTLARCFVGLYAPTSGEILFRGRSLWSGGNYNPQAHREIQLVFQDQSCLNPRMTVDRIVTEPLEIHNVPKRDWTRRFNEVMEMVQLSPSLAGKYPRQLSGGQAQRVIIARALILRPSVLIADEPVSKLDVSVQSHILNSLRLIKEMYSLTLIYISHDLATVDYLCDRIAVMYLGRIVEAGSREVLYDPQHPYTRALVSAVPGHDLPEGRIVLPGRLPDPSNVPSGCRFNTRCPHVEPKCTNHEPDLVERKQNHFSRCHFSVEELQREKADVSP